MTSPFIPNSFTYGDAPQGGAVMPMVIAGRDPSDTIDRQYDAGYLWLSAINLGGSGLLFYQAGNQAGTPTWTVSSSAAGALNTLSDGSTVVLPSGGNIALTGTANQITTTSSGPAHEIVFSLPNNLVAPGSITSTTTMTAGTGLTVSGGGAAITGNSTVTGDLAVSGALTAGSFTLSGLAVNGTVTINTAGAGTTTIGNAAAGAITIDVGTGNFQMNGGGNEIHIGDDAAANQITIGSQTVGAALTLQAGTGDVLITGSVLAAITIGRADGTGAIILGRSTAGQNVSISDAVPAASRTTTIAGGTIIGAVTDTIDIAPDGATTNAAAIKIVNINTGTVATGQVLTNIASGTVTSGTHTTNIATGNRAAGTMDMNIMTGTGTKTLDIGNADGLTTTTILGPVNVNTNQNNNVSINGGTSTGTITIGNTAAGAVILNSGSTIAIGDNSAGAITVDTAAGISLDAATASNFTVTGAALDLTLSSVGGSVNITATEAAADAIVIDASNAAGGVQIKGGTGGILIGNEADTTPISIGDFAPTASRTITVGGGTIITAVTDTIDIGPDGATTNAGATKTVNVNTGGVTLGSVLTNIASGTVTSGTHTTNIATGNRAAGTMAVNLLTGTGVKTLNIGNVDNATVVNVAGNLNLTNVASQITMNGGAATDFIGSATLIGGQATILNTNIAAGDRIMITRSALNASPALGFLLYTINAGVSFVVDSLSATGAAVATDVSSFTYVIIRQT